MKPKVLLLGHSFVRSLKDYLHPSHPFSDLAPELRTSDMSSLQIHGISGAFITNPSHISEFLHILSQENFDMLILDIGTNDLAAGIPPLIVAVEIIKFLEKVLKSQSNLHVMVCSVIPRSSRLNSSESNFKSNIVNYNTYLRNMCSVNSSIHYWKHKGFWADPVSYWSRDGIHPNSRIGRKRYCTSIKNAIFKAVQYSRY